ncbi:hypothetical protein [Serratia marcescens]|uniref:hypothetical protein n=1 Tax=Serratia marcescens TaxID=615 RepID=UPI0029E55ED5|nr:DUF4435 domain-containing protein [Serratia marcescens]
MSDLSYDIDSYITMIKMSSKQRILVEGRSDRLHFRNLFVHFNFRKKPQIDTAQDIRGNTHQNRSCNRRKIEDIHSFCKDTTNTYFLCDREFRNFSVENVITDDLNDHFVDNRLYWTFGHSIENYFLIEEVISDAFLFLSISEGKHDAIELFSKLLPEAFKLISAISLSANICGASSYPIGIIKWQNFIINGSTLVLSDEIRQDNDISNRFIEQLDIHLPIARESNPVNCANLCRGHTAIILLQRLFSKCIFETFTHIDERRATDYANKFNNISEEQLSGTLSESWSRRVKEKLANYPEPLIDTLVKNN